MSELIETVVIGGGQAGLAMSYYLRQAGREHIIIERARIAESWRTERWDSLMFQFPNWSIKLPGHAFEHDNPDGFAPKDTVVKFIEDYANFIQAPVRCNVSVLALQYNNATQRFLVDTNSHRLEAMNVVVATGSYHLPVIPEYAALISRKVFQIHTRDYRNPQQLPPGKILVVGSGASGVQVAEELQQRGRNVYLSVGRHDKVPRRYRQKDLYWWLDAMGIWRLPLAQKPELKTWRPLFTGMAGGHDIDLQQFGASGMALLGRMRGAAGSKLYFAADLKYSLAKSEAWFSSFRSEMDNYAHERSLSLPPNPRPEQSVLDSSSGGNQIEILDLNDAGISSIIWAGGFRYNFNWIELPVFDESGEPRARRGISGFPGLYFLGLRRTYAAGSSLLAGVGDDAAYLAEHITSRN